MFENNQRLTAAPTRRRRRAAAALLAVSLTALAACGGDDSDSGTGSGDSTGGTGGTTTLGERPEGVVQTPRGEALAIGEPTRGGELVFALEGGFQRIDPAGTTSNPLSQLSQSIFGNLMTQDDDGNIVPGMAESMESEDFQTWTMKLRPNVRFHDGTPFNAEAVVAHITRLKDPATKYPYAASLAGIVSVTAQDDLTVIWEVDKPFPRFPLLLTYQGATFVPSPTAIATLGSEFGLKPVGAGPFKVQSVSPDAEVVLVRNEDYWDPELPYLDKIVFKPLSDSEAKLAATQTGDIDIAFTLSDQDWPRAESNGVRVLRQRSFTIQCTLFNAEKAPLDDPRVRRALAVAVDADAINDVVYGGRRHVMDRALPESHPYSNPIENWPAYDPEEAKRLIEEYTAETGKPVEFDISVNIQPEFQQVWTIILQMWEQVGAKPTMSIMDQVEHVAQANSGNYQAQGRYCSTHSQPDVLAFNNWHSTGGSNVANINDPIIDAGLEAFRASDDEAVRKAEFAKATQALIDGNYYIWHTLQSQGFYVGPKVKGFPASHPVSAAYIQAEKLWV